MTSVALTGCLGRVIADEPPSAPESAPESAPVPALGANVTPRADKPVTLAHIDDLVECSAFDASHLYLGGSDGKVWRVDRASGAVESLDKDVTRQFVSSIAVDATHVYWAVHSGRRVKRMNKTTREIELLQEDEDGPHTIALDDAFVYWANTGATGGGGVFRMPKATKEREALALTGPGRQAWVSTIEGGVYVAVDQQLGRLTDRGRTVLTSSFGATDASCPTSPFGGNLYWACESWIGGPVVGRLMRLPLTGGEPEVIARSEKRLKKVVAVPGGVVLVMETATPQDPQNGTSATSLVLHRWGSSIDEELVAFSRGLGNAWIGDTSVVADGSVLYWSEFDIGVDFRDVRIQMLRL